ncbi:MAG: SMI1/KNR4 family protein [Oscillospiraceae bacterium]|nr:SMI1/KNR4 family protein [Oscillospiraceae bacterium]
MVKKFINFLNNLQGASLRAAADDEIRKIKGLSEKLPDVFVEIYSQAVPENKLEYEDFVFYDIDRIYAENTDMVPGVNILPFGLFTFASTFDGDAICVDLNIPDLPVYQCSHSLLSDETEINYYKKDMITLAFNYENILKVSPKLADSLSDFVNKLINNDTETYSVTDIIDML